MSDSYESTASELAARFASQIVRNVILITGCSPGSLAAYVAQTIAAQNPAFTYYQREDSSTHRRDPDDSFTTFATSQNEHPSNVRTSRIPCVPVSAVLNIARTRLYGQN